jgi:hypothetical protein
MKKINNNILILGLAGLVGIFIISKLFRSPKLEGNIRKELVSIDTADITELRMQSADEQPKLVKLVKEKNSWRVTQDDKSYPADKATVDNLLSTVASLNAERMVSRKQDKWDSYKVGEKSTSVSVYEGGKKATEFRVGKTGFSQDPTAQQFGNQGIEAFTYVRLADEDEVYMVNGFLEATFNRGVNELRDKSFLRFSRDAVTKVTFTYPADSSFVLERRDTLWFVGSRIVNKGTAENYVREISSKSQASFADGFTAIGGPTAKVQIDGAAGMIATFEGWKSDAGWYLRSSLQPEVFFLDSDPNSTGRLFPGAQKF